MAAVIREARTQLETQNIQEDVYVPFDFARERKFISNNNKGLGEELYMAMS